VNEAETIRLLGKWLRAEVTIIGEFSSDSIAEYKRLIEEGRAIARRLGVDWDKVVIPDHVTTLLAFDDEWDME
jgi:hypothetical protein